VIPARNMINAGNLDFFFALNQVIFIKK